MEGKVFFTGKTGQAEEPVDISAFPPGLYIAVLYADDEKIAVGKFVVR